jgi:hypothetical protein
LLLLIKTLLFIKRGWVLVLKTRLLPLLLLNSLFSYFNYVSYYTSYKVYYYAQYSLRLKYLHSFIFSIILLNNNSEMLLSVKVKQ